MPRLLALTLWLTLVAPPPAGHGPEIGRRYPAEVHGAVAAPCTSCRGVDQGANGRMSDACWLAQKPDCRAILGDHPGDGIG